MIRIKPIVFASIASACLALAASAQDPAAAPGQVQQNSTVRDANQAKRPAVTRTQARRRSIVHHYPYPYPNYYQGDRTAGWRNPGGVGRFREYYPSGDQFQANYSAGRDPVPTASFGGGGIPSREEQLQAQQVGVQKDNALQQHIDNYARPYYGYGFGVGYFGGFY